jgi:hypothetical protein
MKIWEAYQEIERKGGHGRIQVDIVDFEWENLDTQYRQRNQKKEKKR